MNEQSTIEHWLSQFEITFASKLPTKSAAIARKEASTQLKEAIYNRYVNFYVVN